MVDEADYLLVESTYGNRVHEKDDNGDRLAQAIKATADRGGKLIVPAFAVGRVEEVLYWIKRLEDERRIPVLPVFVDSPMATEALGRYTERVRELDPEISRKSGTKKRRTGALPVTNLVMSAASRRVGNVRSASSAPSASERSRRRRNPRISRRRRCRRSSSRRAAWRPVAACCITSRRRYRTHGTRCSWSGFRPPEHVGASWSMAHQRSRFTAR